MTTTVRTRSPLLDRPSAVAGEGRDALVAAHYGDPLREQRAASEGVAVVDRTHREVVRIGGADRLSWLHSLSTQHLTALPAGTGTETLVLSPHGHVEHHLLLADDGETITADVEPGTSADLLTFLDRMRFLLQVEPADASDELAVLTLLGPDAAGAVTGVAAVADDWAVTPLPAGGCVRRVPWPSTALPPAYDLVVPRAGVVDVWDALVAAGAVHAGLTAYDALRVEARRPRLGSETDHKTIPHEVGWLETAVHLEKGCYRGQETVARVHNLGRPPRRLVQLHLDGSVVELPPQGTPVLWDGVAVGFVGTAVLHHELGPVALALVKRNTPDDAPLLAGTVPAAITP
jgi:folate-binding protein YgfZ